MAVQPYKMHWMSTIVRYPRGRTWHITFQGRSPSKESKLQQQRNHTKRKHSWTLQLADTLVPLFVSPALRDGTLYSFFSSFFLSFFQNQRRQCACPRIHSNTVWTRGSNKGENPLGKQRRRAFSLPQKQPGSHPSKAWPQRASFCDPVTGSTCAHACAKNTKCAVSHLQQRDLHS
jgi:hypothetical protein